MGIVIMKTALLVAEGSQTSGGISSAEEPVPFAVINSKNWFLSVMRLSNSACAAFSASLNLRSFLQPRERSYQRFQFLADWAGAEGPYRFLFTKSSAAWPAWVSLFQTSKPMSRFSLWREVSLPGGEPFAMIFLQNVKISGWGTASHVPRNRHLWIGA